MGNVWSISTAAQDHIVTGNSFFDSEHKNRYIVAADCYRKAIKINPNADEAIFKLAECIQKGVNIEIGDLVGTPLDGFLLVDPKRLTAELYKKALLINPKNEAARARLTHLDEAEPIAPNKKRHSPR